MFAAQLAAFLVAHHHIRWAEALFTGPMPPHRYLRILVWAARHGFVYHP